jgi:CRP-like cAMP-binding protein
MKKDARIDLLRGVWLFERCSRGELTKIASVATPVVVPIAKTLAHEGDIGREFFLLLSGEAEVTRNGTTVATLTPGSFFGEMALLDRQPRAATVITTQPCEVLVVTHQAFTEIVNTMPSVDRKMLAVLANRLRDLEDRYLPAEQSAPPPARADVLDLTHQPT